MVRDNRDQKDRRDIDGQNDCKVIGQTDLEIQIDLSSCFEIRHLIYSHFTIYNMYNCCTHARMYAWILSIASVRPKPNMDADVNFDFFLNR